MMRLLFARHANWFDATIVGFGAIQLHAGHWITAVIIAAIGSAISVIGENSIVSTPSPSVTREGGE